MTTELATIIVAIAGIVALVAWGLVWWMNRTPHASRHTSEALPLFGAEIDQTGRYLSDDRGGVDPSPGIEPGAEALASSLHEPPGAAGSAMARRASARPPAGAPRKARQTPAQSAPMERAEPEHPRRAAKPSAERKREDEPLRPARPGPTIRTFTTSRKAAVDDPERFAPPPAQGETRPVPAASTVVAHGVPGTMVEGTLLRYSVPAEGTLQFLPGRLEIASGADQGREFRFVHVPGPNGMEVTFGRSEGELYKHIQLRHQTVSRTHARLRLDNGGWLLQNLSNTNPVVYNGRVLSNAEEQPLSDGDRIEMGEVLFTFRSR